MGNVFQCMGKRNRDLALDPVKGTSKTKSKSTEGQDKVLSDVILHHNISMADTPDLTVEERNVISDIDNLLYLMENNIIFDPQNIPNANFKSLFRLLVLYNKFDHKMGVVARQNSKESSQNETIQSDDEFDEEEPVPSEPKNPKSKYQPVQMPANNTNDAKKQRSSRSSGAKKSIPLKNGAGGKVGTVNEDDDDLNPDEMDMGRFMHERRRTVDVIDTTLNEFNRGSHWERAQSIPHDHPFSRLIDKILNYLIFNLNTNIDSHKYMKQLLSIEWIVQAFNQKQYTQLVAQSKKHLIVFHRQLVNLNETTQKHPKFSELTSIKSFEMYSRQDDVCICPEWARTEENQYINLLLKMSNKVKKEFDKNMKKVFSKDIYHPALIKSFHRMSSSLKSNQTSSPRSPKTPNSDKSDVSAADAEIGADGVRLPRSAANLDVVRGTITCDTIESLVSNFNKLKDLLESDPSLSNVHLQGLGGASLDTMDADAEPTEDGVEPSRTITPMDHGEDTADHVDHVDPAPIANQTEKDAEAGQLEKGVKMEKIEKKTCLKIVRVDNKFLKDAEQESEKNGKNEKNINATTENVAGMIDEEYKCVVVSVLIDIPGNYKYRIDRELKESLTVVFDSDGVDGDENSLKMICELQFLLKDYLSLKKKMHLFQKIARTRNKNDVWNECANYWM